MFILFAANPTAGMDWSDAALEANYRQMVQLYGMPSSILSWNGEAKDIDLWMKARLKQRCIQWQDAMDNYDLRGAVDASHFDIIKDLNWYREVEKIQNLKRDSGCMDTYDLNCYSTLQKIGGNAR